jgi:hypothetical protein
MAKRSANPEPVELVMARYETSTRKFELGADVVKKVLTSATVLGCVWIVIQGVVNLAEKTPSTVAALASVVKELRLHTIVGYIVGTAGLTAWYAERQGKKRAIRENGNLRHRLEKDDAYNSRSGLDPSGDTPR